MTRRSGGKRANPERRFDLGIELAERRADDLGRQNGRDLTCLGTGEQLHREAVRDTLGDELGHDRCLAFVRVEDHPAVGLDLGVLPSSSTSSGSRARVLITRSSSGPTLRVWTQMKPRFRPVAPHASVSASSSVTGTPARAR